MKTCMFCGKELDPSEEFAHLRRQNGTQVNIVCDRHWQFAYVCNTDLVTQALKINPQVVTSEAVLDTLYRDSFTPKTII